jgi:hypothetical protein
MNHIIRAVMSLMVLAVGVSCAHAAPYLPDVTILRDDISYQVQSDGTFVIYPAINH